jgi:cell division initiation protein
MIDLTPLDVRKKRGDFRRLLRGYDPEEVDTFLELVAERLESLVKENLALTERVEGMAGRLEALEGKEKAVQDALVTAQKLREEVADQSRREADLLRKEAEAEVERRLREAEGLIGERQRALEDLERNRMKFLKAFRSLLERELDAVEVEEARRPLEEAPLELTLRGWKRPGGTEDDRGGKEGAGDSSGEEDSGGTEGPPGADGRETEPESESGRADVGVRETVADEGSGEDRSEAEEAPEVETPDAAWPGGEEPLWLSSLLKEGDGGSRRGRNTEVDEEGETEEKNPGEAG